MRHRVWESLLRFWANDRGLSIFLGLLVIFILVLPAFGRTGSHMPLVTDIVFSALLVSGALSLPERRWVRWVVPLVAAVALIMRWVVAATAVAADLTAWRELSTLITLMLFAVVVAGQAYRSGAVTPHRIQGAVAVYLLLGLTWANAYQLLYHLRPEAFTGGLDAASLPQTWIYYSFVTLTTTGYGDITPVHPVARSLTITEALTGQLYLAITLARLVALQVSARNRG